MFSKEEHKENLKRLNIENYESLIGKEVYYSLPIYGVHKVLSWDADNEEFLLDLDGQKFWSNPFRIKNID